MISVPKYYNPYIHLFLPSLIALIINIICLYQIKNISYELIIIPLMLFILNGFEWFVHKNILHKSNKITRHIYKKHYIHHKLYDENNMFLKEKNELHYILMPSYALLLILVGLIPIFSLIFILNANIAYLMLIVSSLYFIFYEIMHLIYHLPFFKNNKIISFLREHHFIHHISSFNNKNYNVTVPIFDWILKTKVLK